MSEGTQGGLLLPLRQAERETGMRGSIYLWAGGNVIITTMLVGGYFASSVGLYGMMVTVLVGTALGCLWPALSGLRSVRYGVDEYVGMRTSWGVRGAVIGVFIAVGINVGWMSILCQLPASTAGKIIGQMTGNEYGQTAGLNLFTAFVVFAIVAPALIVAFRPTLVFALTKWAVPILSGLAIYMLVKLFMGPGWGTLASMEPARDLPFAFGIECVVAYCMSWFPYIGAWNRYAKTEKAGFWGVWLGLGIAGVIFALIGGLAALGYGTADPAGWAAKAGLGIPAIVVFVLSTLIINSLLLYCSVCALTTTFPRAKYRLMTFIVFAPSLALAFQGGILDKFNVLLSGVGALAAPIWGICVGDYFLVRRQRISVPDLYARRGQYWFTGGWNLGAVVVFIVGVVFWLVVAGWTTLLGPLQSMTPGWGQSVYSVLTASAPCAALCAILYYLVGYKIGWALRSNRSLEDPLATGAVRGKDQQRPAGAFARMTADPDASVQ